MKSLFLENVTSIEETKEALRRLLPGQEQPWILCESDGDTIAYFYVESELDYEPNLHVQANISGRHYFRDAGVLDVLHKLQETVGGIVTDDSYFRD